MRINATIGCVGDYGNPDGTGYSRMTLAEIAETDQTAARTKLNTFHAALVTAQLTATVKADGAVTYNSETYVAKPDNDVNIDRKLVVRWRTLTDSSVHRLTIPGVPLESTGIEMVDSGERLNAVGKAALETAIEAMYGLSADTVVVLGGVVLQPA
jgi:hypothetical protein